MGPNPAGVLHAVVQFLRLICLLRGKVLVRNNSSYKVPKYWTAKTLKYLP